jgi:hypothetical protein
VNEPSIVLLVCLIVIVILATLLYAAGWGHLSALGAVGELRAIIVQILAHTQNIDESLRQQRRVLYDTHKRVSVVTKGVGKPAA